MKTKEIIVIIALFAVVIGFTIWYQNNKSLDGSRVCFGENCFVVEVVDSAAERTTGLMNRESLADDRGMLFIFDSEALYPFWMKNTLIPLDMIWLDADKKIVAIQENAVPCVADPCPIYNPKVPALYVVELNGGTVAAKDIKVGEQVRFVGIKQ